MNHNLTATLFISALLVLEIGTILELLKIIYFIVLPSGSIIVIFQAR